MIEIDIQKQHIPVLLHEVVEGIIQPSMKVVVDGTLGLGGHSEAILQKLHPHITLIGIDKDATNLKKAQTRLKKYQANIKFVHDDFVNIKSISKKFLYDKVDAIILDLGLSSPHIDNQERGFSFYQEGPLDMRFNQEQELTAEIIINRYSEQKLADIIYQYGEEKRARKIAKIICKARKKKKFTSTRELATEIEKNIKNKKKHPALLTFQALRIAVNNELDLLYKCLEDAADLLSIGKRLAVISYHSLEDRIVKQFFRFKAKHCVCPKEILLCKCQHQASLKIITKKPIRPSLGEIEKNSRARSAKLRIAEKII